MAKHQHLKLNKGLGQHFLTDVQILHRIKEVIEEYAGAYPLVEVGPGAGSLSELLQSRADYKLVEFDERWASYLPKQFPELVGKVVQGDILRVKLAELFPNQMAIVGNFPYNISSQILFKVLDNREQVPVCVGMFQKEVAERVCSKPGSKVYGITSVLLQAFYNCTYLFDVPRSAFNPPPKVVSGVILLERKEGYSLPCDFSLFKTVVKTSFNQRRKMLRSSLKSIVNPAIRDLEIFSERPEQLSVDAFINLTNIIDVNREQ